MVDDAAAYRLLTAVVLQARRDITRRIVQPEDRVTAYQIFQAVAMVEGDNDGVPNIPNRARGGYRVGA